MRLFINEQNISLRTAASHRITQTEKTYKSNNNNILKPNIQIVIVQHLIYTTL